jgi:acyl-coenzyme A thioesterase PaaI-like protein
MKPIFNTDKKSGPESEKIIKRFNNIPAFVATGGEIIFVSEDLLEVHTKFNLNEKTMNYHKSGFGGAIYSSLDPIYPLQFIYILGDKYVVWDLAAKIDYLKPIYSDVYARFLLTQQHINDIKEKIKVKNRAVIELSVEYTDLDNKNIYARASKTIYIADKEYFENKNK